MTLSTPVDRSGQAIRVQVQNGQELTRNHPLPASPHWEGHEPDDYAQHMERYRREETGRESIGRAAHDDDAAQDGDAAHGPMDRPTVHGLLHAFRSGAQTPTEVLKKYLDRWAVSPDTATAILSPVNGAMQAAAESGHRWANGTARPLEGIPFGVKDIIDVQGAAVTCGSLQTGDRKADRDAEVIARLRATGAIPVAMTATTEFAMGAADNARYGVVPNPWDRSRWTGGSSTGSAAGVAAGLFPFAVGTDTGGSIRIPAAFCGISGLKPTNGRIPRTGVATLSWSLDHVGPMGLSASDLRLVLAAMDHPAGALSAQEQRRIGQPNGARSLAGVVVGVLGGWHLELLDSEVDARFTEALEILRRLGATVKIIQTPGYDAALAHVEAWNVFYGEIAATQEANLGTVSLFDSGTRDRFEVGRRLPAIDYLRGLRRRGLVLDTLVRAMDESGVDVVVLPTAPAGAPEISNMTMSINGTPRNIHDVLPRNTRIFDYTGLPALGVPMGLTSEGLPLSMQIAGRPWADFDVLAVGESFQARSTFHLAMPPSHADS